MSTRYVTCTETAKLVRTALAQAFPGTKFQVRSRTYSGGASIDVRWQDGPTQQQGEAIAGQFAGASFDGMIDLMSYHTSELAGEPVRYGADFVFCRRTLSAAFVRRCAAEVCVQWGFAVPPIAESYGDAYIADAHLYPVIRPNSYNQTLADEILAVAQARAA